MKKISLTRNHHDVTTFSVLIILVALIFAITNLYNRPKGVLVVNTYIEGQKIDTNRLDYDKTVIYYKENYPILRDDVTVEIKNNKVRVEKEDSPLHYCSLQGWVGNAGYPIICAPNYFMLVIEAAS